MWGLEDADKQPSEGDDAEPKNKKPVEPDEEDDTDTEDEAEENSEETPEDDSDDEDGESEGEQPTIEVKDDHKFKVTVDGEEREFTLGQLKRLAGQEASLTRKSQDVAGVRKQLDTRAATTLAQYNKLIERAQARYEPYSKIDFLAASKDPNVTAEELVAVRNAAQAAYEDLRFLETEAAALTNSIQEAQRADLIAQAKEAITILSDPEKGIEGWNEQLYGKIRAFALDNGISAEVVNNLVDPAAIKLLNMARLYAKGKVKVQTEKSDKKKAPKRIVKSTSSAEEVRTVSKTNKTQRAFKRLETSGSVDDAADAFEAMWSAGNNE